MEYQANLLGSAILMPLAQVKRCFYQLRSGRSSKQIVAEAAELFQVSKQAILAQMKAAGFVTESEAETVRCLAAEKYRPETVREL